MKIIGVINAKSHISDICAPSEVHHGFKYVMKTFHARGFKPHIMHTLNKCRMYLFVITVEYIANPHGTHIEKEANQDRNKQIPPTTTT